MSKPFREYGRYGSVGIELVLSILIGFYVGKWCDERFFGGHTWGGIIGLFLGMAVGFRQLFKTASFMQRDIERAEKQARGEDPWEDEIPLDDGKPRDEKRR